jgi:hypothetical protein
VAELRYKAWGETRYTDGTTPTAYKFTGQRLDDAVGCTTAPQVMARCQRAALLQEAVRYQEA